MIDSAVHRIADDYLTGMPFLLLCTYMGWAAFQSGLLWASVSNLKFTSISISATFSLASVGASTACRGTKRKIDASILETTKSGTGGATACPNTAALPDPVPHGDSREAAWREGVSLTQPDFLIYQATVSGGKAFRNLLMPKFIESLKELDAKDDVLKACVRCNEKIRSYLDQNDPENTVWQLPIFQSTFKHSLLLNKTFPTA